jgi:molecular chaperone DnaJ
VVQDHYVTLGISRDASGDDIKRAYRKLARELHPDVNPDPRSQERFQEVTHAYEILSDPEQRRSYDMGGDGALGGGFGFGDIMDAFFGGGGSRGPRARVRRGQDALIRIDLTLQEAAFGVERELTVETAITCEVCTGTGCAPGTSPTTCELCRGRGEVQQVTRSILGQMMTSRPCANCQGYGTTIKQPCGECAGDGRVRSRSSLHIDVPAGIDDGNRIQLSGKGEVGPGGGPSGDLYVEVHIQAHESLVRDGDDLHTPLAISMVDAALGTTVEIESLDGVLELTVPQGTQSGTTIPMRGKGVTQLRGSGRGDLFVHVEVVIPTRLSEKEAELLRSFAQLRGDNERVSVSRTRSGESGFFSRLKEVLGR